MRAKVASRAGGHAFEERFLNLDPAQLTVLFFQASKEERDEKKEQVEVINKVNEIWSKRLKNITEGLQFFSNPKMFKAMLDMAETKVLKEEINEDNFPEVWESILKSIPEEYVVEDPTESIEDYLVNRGKEMNDELDDVISGWVSTSRKFRKD